MAYICEKYEDYAKKYEKKPCANGQCVRFVQECTNAPITAFWKQGEAVRDNFKIKSGTAIATFDKKGRYPNRASGNHAAVYISQDVSGIWVYDQWVGRGAVKKRHIRFKGGQGSPSDDGDAFSVIE